MQNIRVSLKGYVDCLKVFFTERKGSYFIRKCRQRKDKKEIQQKLAFSSVIFAFMTQGTPMRCRNTLQMTFRRRNRLAGRFSAENAEMRTVRMILIPDRRPIFLVYNLLRLKFSCNPVRSGGVSCPQIARIARLTGKLKALIFLIS